MNASLEYLLIQNLYHAAKAHRDSCNVNCNVSIILLKEAAKYIWSKTRDMSNDENKEIDMIFDNWDSLL